MIFQFHFIYFQLLIQFLRQVFVLFVTIPITLRVKNANLANVVRYYKLTIIQRNNLKVKYYLYFLVCFISVIKTKKI